MDCYVKDQAAVASYTIDWGVGFPGPPGIAASTWEISPAEAGGLALQMSGHDGRTARASIGGGLAGRVYRLANRVTLNDGSSDVRSVLLRVEER
ncbi:MAG TPA: hypothetical protein VEZ41_07770 [Allosphingosinicella sp.]|nr:hypothetical protein [Allosphingosinicella sp.]